MNDMMEKLLKKKKPSEMTDEYKDAKKGALKDLIGEMSKMMAEPLKSGKMEQVTVAAKDKEGLQKGLEKAHEMMSDEEESEPACACGEGESCPMCEDKEESSEEEGMSLEKIDEMISKLEAMKKAKMAE